jgi:hypothetical protein
MRRNPPHHLSPAWANHPAGHDPEPVSTAPSQHSNAPIATGSQSFLSKIVARCVAKQDAMVMRRFESFRPSQAVRPVAVRPRPIAEKPAHGCLLQFYGRSPSSQSTVWPAENAESLWRPVEEFPLSGDSDRRRGSICTERLACSVIGLPKARPISFMRTLAGRPRLSTSDIVGAYGIMHGAIEVELATRILSRRRTARQR